MTNPQEARRIADQARATFAPQDTTDPRVTRCAGPVVVVRSLRSDEHDVAEVGPMYRVRVEATGDECDAFADELTLTDD